MYKHQLRFYQTKPFFNILECHASWRIPVRFESTVLSCKAFANVVFLCQRLAQLASPSSPKQVYFSLREIIIFNMTRKKIFLGTHLKCQALPQKSIHQTSRKAHRVLFSLCRRSSPYRLWRGRVFSNLSRSCSSSRQTSYQVSVWWVFKHI